MAGADGEGGGNGARGEGRKEPGSVSAIVREALDAAFGREEAVAVLLAQKLVGRKDWGDGK